MECNSYLVHQRRFLGSDANCVVAQLKDLRTSLRSAGRTEDGAHLFTTLYRSWCHSLGAVLSLCFLSEVAPRTILILLPILLLLRLHGVSWGLSEPSALCTDFIAVAWACLHDPTVLHNLIPSIRKGLRHSSSLTTNLLL